MSLLATNSNPKSKKQPKTYCPEIAIPTVVVLSEKRSQIKVNMNYDYIL
jgi:hypothetical protein